MGIDARNVGPGMITNQNLDYVQSVDKFEAERATMELVAADTGGKAFTSTNGIREAIQTAIEQGSDYYTLSYSPANTNFDGRFRKIEVKLARPNLQARTRSGYFSLPVSQNSSLAAGDMAEAWRLVGLRLQV